jgi:hypothetical protein
MSKPSLATRIDRTRFNWARRAKFRRALAARKARLQILPPDNAAPLNSPEAKGQAISRVAAPQGAPVETIGSDSKTNSPGHPAQSGVAGLTDGGIASEPFEGRAA